VARRPLEASQGLASTLIHTAAILRLSLDQPLVITVVDRPERIERILEPLREMAPNALIVVQEVEVIQSGAPSRKVYLTYRFPK